MIAMTADIEGWWEGVLYALSWVALALWLAYLLWRTPYPSHWAHWRATGTWEWLPTSNTDRDPAKRPPPET